MLTLHTLKKIGHALDVYWRVSGEITPRMQELLDQLERV